MEYKYTIKSHKHLVEYEDFGEHHMGSNHIRLRLEREFDGVIEFHSTNGNATFDESGEVLLVGDACMLLLLNYKDGAVKHCYPPSGCFFSDRTWIDGAVRATLYGTQCSERVFGPVSIDDPVFQPGLGKSKGGFMPSMHDPYYRAIFKPSPNT